MDNNVQTKRNSSNGLLKFIVFSLVGIFMFFIPINIGGKSTIPLDHIVTGIKKGMPSLTPIYALIVIIIGGIAPFYKKTWNKDKVTVVFSFLKLLGVLVAFMAYFHFGPAWLFEKDMVPFLFNKLVIPVGLIVPIGAIFLAFLVGYGLLEFIGVLMRPVMKPIWKTPGRSAVDAVASFVGSYSIGLLITNRVFKEGKYTVKEACIIATGFSTVSATFMIIVAKTLGLMEMWNTFFWTTLIITFIVTAITVRIKPLSSKDDSYITGEGDPEPEFKGNLFKKALDEGLKAAEESPSLVKNIMDNLKDGFVMAMGILPSILSVGLLGLILAKYTPIFDIIGYIFYPFALLLRVPQPMLAAKAMAVEVAEMFLPALLVASAPLITKFIIGVISISSILFFSASIPCILSTEIPISITEILIIWIERTILTLLIVAPLAFLIL
ncbi:nucleoside recognition GATE domain-containing membrane protein YjiH [Caminicella sporogenes DSM 14501]|uniref:Nucleoside recognition GATE domain-containing membrane protein YjiH n=1 Tax=Caminicella sporogenes DSM 14501 TaxID=1121266 RepID=A0A1M6NP98_9FIRM|nr:YjiH family protein [Caminicella sporogenes]RKD22136.1 histidine transporter [Caminicella sporogenes]WIF95752.1 YjiH family protein [Caminicella sporogenes]SHJ97488.1 nucleoside recognition GATE domain-containing membrane protein YjiH [Caminicella sporogenes DSM 14501]